MTSPPSISKMGGFFQAVVLRQASFRVSLALFTSSELLSCQTVKTSIIEADICTVCCIRPSREGIEEPRLFQDFIRSSAVPKNTAYGVLRHFRPTRTWPSRTPTVPLTSASHMHRQSDCCTPRPQGPVYSACTHVALDARATSPPDSRTPIRYLQDSQHRPNPTDDFQGPGLRW